MRTEQELLVERYFHGVRALRKRKPVAGVEKLIRAFRYRAWMDRLDRLADEHAVVRGWG